ncbi:MAG: oligosaccharide flippase family protein [Sulfurimonas sp.]|nr:oligosaccharide flippase family protein [Sulfurimonas sp.]
MKYFRKISDIVIGSSLFRSAGVYTVANVLNKALPFLMIPVLTRYLTPAEYGTLAMVTVLIGFIGPFTGLNISGAVHRKFYERDQIDFPAYVANSLFILIASTLLMALLMKLFGGQVSRVSQVPSGWLWAVVFVSACQFLISIYLVILQGQVKPFSYGSFQILQTAMNVGISLYLVVIVQMGWEGSIWGQVLAFGTFACIAFVSLKRNGWLRFRIHQGYIRQALKFGIPLIPHTFSAFLMTMTDRIFITNLVGIADTGIYSVGNQVGMVIGLLAASFNTAYVPWLFQRLTQNDNVVKRRIVYLTYFYYGCIFIGAVMLALVAPIFMRIFVGDSFRGAAAYIVWFALANAFNGMYLMVTNYIFFTEKTHLLAMVSFATAAFSIPLTYLLIKQNGAIGGAQAATITFFIKFIATWWISSRVYPMPWGLGLKPETV